MLIALIRGPYSHPLVAHQYSHILYTHYKNLKTLHALPSVCGCASVHLPKHTPQEVSNPLHYITNNNGCFHESNHVSLLNRLYILYTSIYQLMFYIYISLNIHSFVKPLEHLHLPTLLFLLVVKCSSSLNRLSRKTKPATCVCF